MDKEAGMDREGWAQETAKKLHLPNNWARRVIEIWLRDNCSCVYCELNMLENRETAYFFSSTDHLLPVGVWKYKELENEFWNQVLACRNCNGLKHTFDPAQDGIPPDKEHRLELIERAKNHIQKRRQDLEMMFATEKQKLQDALNGYPNDLAAAAGRA